MVINASGRHAKCPIRFSYLLAPMFPFATICMWTGMAGISIMWGEIFWRSVHLHADNIITDYKGDVKLGLPLILGLK